MASGPEAVPEARSLMRVSRMQLGGEELAVFSFPLPPVAVPSDLTPAERAVVADLLTGKSNAEIASRRGRSVRTIANQVASIFRKLGIASRSELALALAHRASP